MATQPISLDQMVADPRFRALPVEDQKILITKARTSALPQPQMPAPPPGLQRSFGEEVEGAYRPQDIDTAIDIARPFAASAAGGAAASVSGLAAPVTGPLAYTAVDALLQHLKSQPEQSTLSNVIGAKPGGVASTLANTAQQAALIKGLDKIFGATVHVGKAIRNADQPEIVKFLPTTSQLAKSGAEGATGWAKTKLNVLSGGAKALEDLNVGSKAKALDRAAGAGFTEQLKLVENSDFGKLMDGAPNYSPDPYVMQRMATAQMPYGAGSQTPVKFVDRGRAVTPIRIEDLGRPVTPIKITDPGVEVTPVSFKAGEIPQKSFRKPEITTIPEKTKTIPGGELQVVPGETRTLKGGAKVVHAGETKTLPGGEIEAIPGQPKLNLYDSEAKLQEVVSNETVRQDVLATAAANGIEGNVKSSLGSFNFNKIYTDSVIATNVEGAVTRLDPSKVTKGLGRSQADGSFQDLYTSRDRASIKQFFSNIINTQDKAASGVFSTRFWMWHSGIGVGMGLFTGSMTGSFEGLAAGLMPMGVLITAQQVGKILAKPTVARIMVALAGKEALGVSEAYAGRMLSRALEGSTVALVNAKGERTPVLVSKGKLVPIQ